MWILKTLHRVGYSCGGIFIGHYKIALENMVVEN